MLNAPNPFMYNHIYCIYLQYLRWAYGRSTNLLIPLFLSTIYSQIKRQRCLASGLEPIRCSCWDSSTLLLCVRAIVNVSSRGFTQANNACPAPLRDHRLKPPWLLHGPPSIRVCSGICFAYNVLVVPDTLYVCARSLSLSLSLSLSVALSFLNVVSIYVYISTLMYTSGLLQNSTPLILGPVSHQCCCIRQLGAPASLFVSPSRSLGLCILIRMYPYA